MNTTINYKENFMHPQPGTAWVKPMSAAPVKTKKTTASVVNMAVDADTMAAPTENNDAVIFDREDVSFEQ